ncbi:MAG: hypothetical protein MUC72_10450 [Acidobacteria bacterium]|nr:hypothetical protein [Acidobacteriota bacterium]
MGEANDLSSNFDQVCIPVSAKNCSFKGGTMKILFGALLLVVLLCVAPMRAQSPVDQAAQAGFPLLTEFTLRPGDQPFTTSYVAQADGPHRMMAAWGATVALRLEVHGAGPDPSSGQGNPASVPFAAKKGLTYTIRISPAGNLPITSVGQLYGGPRRTQAMTQMSGELVQATPMPLPAPTAPEATPMPLPGPQPAMKPLAMAVINKITAPIDWAATLKTASAMPAMGQLLSSLPGGVSGAMQQVGGNVARVRAPTVPESTSALDWRTGLAFRSWSEPPAYYLNGNKYYVGALEAFPVELVSYPARVTDQAKEILRIWPWPRGLVYLALELPAEHATYAITVRTSDAQGTLRSTWAAGDPPIVSLKCERPWMAAEHKSVCLPLTVTSGPLGFSTLITVSPPDTPTIADSWGGGKGMRKVNLMLTLAYETVVGTSNFKAPALFGGIDIKRIN